MAEPLRPSAQRPLASVVVNNYNYARFLPHAIDSALAQTYAPLEVIVVDDGSTDESRAVIQSYGDRIIALLKENGGQASAFNAGFAAARGDVIVFLDADDVLLPDAVQQAMAAFAPGVVKVHWPLWEIDQAGHRTGIVHPERALEEGNLKERSTLSGPVAGNSPPTSGNAWSRHLLEQVLPMPEQEFRINADGYLLTLAWIYGDVRALPAPLALYRVHGENLFAAGSAEQKMRRHLEKYVHNCEALAAHLRAMGIQPNTALWKLWKGIYDAEVDAALKVQLSAVVPDDARFILIDENGCNPAFAAALLADGRAIPFLERNGQYWGRPADDLAAIQELERLREAGAEFLVFTWYTFWWLEHYAAWAAYLDHRYSCLQWNHFLAIYDLRRAEVSAEPQRADRPLVSIVVNNYNYARFLGEAIDSALAQTYAPLEVVVVDDGSTDNSRDVIESYGNRIVPVLQPNRGQGAAFNAGFSASCGDVVIFLDADDVLLPGAVERAVAQLGPDVVKVHWPLLEIDADRRVTGRVLPSEQLAEGDLREVTLRDGNSGSTSAPTSGNAWARSFLSRVMPLPESAHRIGADAYLFGIAPAFGTIRRLDAPQGLYRIHGSNQWQGRPLQERVKYGLLTAEQQWRVLSGLAGANGVEPDLERWRDHSFFHRLRAGLDDIEALVREGEAFILADEGRWAVDADIEGRRVIPFLERDGHYWGVPPDDATAIQELERLRVDHNAALIAFAWPAHWWLEYYADFTAYLRARYACVLANDRVTAFVLRNQTGAEHSRL